MARFISFQLSYLKTLKSVSRFNFNEFLGLILICNMRKHIILTLLEHSVS